MPAGSSTAPPTRSATRAISCSPPRASSSPSCASRSATCDKDETRKLARDFGLAVAEKSDSQDICFVPTGRYTQVIERLRPGAAEAGNIVHVDGRVLGRHGGIINYTIGQRKGIGVAGAGAALCAEARCRAPARWWSARARPAHAALRLRDVNWLGDEPLRGSSRLRARRSSPGSGRAGRCSRRGLSLDEDGVDRRARSWRGRRVARTGLRLLCRKWRRGAASWRRMDQVRRRKRMVGQRRLRGIRGTKRNREGVGGRIAVKRRINRRSRSERERGLQGTRDGRGFRASCLSPLGASL